MPLRYRLYITTLTTLLLLTRTTHADDTATAGLEIDWLVELTKGGMTGLVLFILASLAVTLIIERFIRLRPSTLIPADLATRAKPLWHAGRWDELTALCRKHPSTLARMIQFLVDHRDAPADLLIQGATGIADRAILAEQKKSHALTVIAGLAPLLGLLGTIIGMIESFKLVELYGDDGGATVLAGSISKALITTALGLVIAIPCVAFHHVFRYRIHHIGQQLEETLDELVNAWLLHRRKE